MAAGSRCSEVKGLSVQLQRGSERRPVLGRRRLRPRRPAGIGHHRRERFRQDGRWRRPWSAGSSRRSCAPAAGSLPWPRPVRACPMPRGWRLRGRQIGYIGADPGSSFDPTIPVGMQIAEKLRAVRPDDRRGARPKSASWPCSTGSISRPPQRRFDEFPFQYSGGMMQRAMIVDALVAEPGFLICDNITQPLDVTVAAQIMRLLQAAARGLRRRHPVHRHLGADRCARSPTTCSCCSHGRIVERSTPDELIHAPQARL